MRQIWIVSKNIQINCQQTLATIPALISTLFHQEEINK